MGRLCANVWEKYFIAVLIFLRYDQHCFSNVSNSNISSTSISHQQAVVEHWDLPNTEIFQSKDVASVWQKVSGNSLFFWETKQQQQQKPGHKLLLTRLNKQKFWPHTLTGRLSSSRRSERRGRWRPGGGRIKNILQLFPLSYIVYECTPVLPAQCGALYSILFNFSNLYEV
jgi:hypothetical protein